MRIAVAGFMHESNTWNPRLADRAAFAAQGLAFGEDVRREWADSHHEMGGFLAGEGRFGYEAVPVLMAWATPSGPVDHAFFDELAERLVDGVQGVDGLLLALHGAMATTACLDPDTELLARLRAKLGEDFPLAATFDLHGNLSPRLPSVCRLATSYRTNPHLDQRETGLRAAGLLVRWIKGEIAPRLAISKPPLLCNIMRQDSSQEPFAGTLRRAREAGGLCADFLPGFAYADVPHVGPSFLVVAEKGAQEIADGLGKGLWEERERWRADLPDAAEAVRRAIASPRPPAVIVETGDNVGGGSAGDSTAV
ncbi:MAG: M81 family metallopeptidase, partial [Gemmataceae bacterium]|nr:M81 family metallopeptidase [Gemmataceae bacterium]